MALLSPFLLVGNSPALKLKIDKPGPSQQVRLESSIINDRSHLFKGFLTYSTLQSMRVGEVQQVYARLSAIGKNSPALKVPRGNVVGSRSLRVGGVEEANLSVGGDGVDVSSVGTARRTIGRPGDQALWTWTVSPGKPGDYVLDLVVTTYQGKSDNPISIVSPPIQIGLHVTATTGSFWSNLGTVGRVLVTIAGVLAAVATIMAVLGDKIVKPIQKFRAKMQSGSQAPELPSNRKRSSSRKSGRSGSGTRRSG